MTDKESKWICSECGFIVYNDKEVKNCPNCMADERELYKIDD